MKSHLRAVLISILACSALIAAVRVGQHTLDRKSPPRGPYVALGDSYTAGPGIPDQNGTPAGCDRSDRNYPALVAQHLGLAAADVRDMSCSGATTADLAGAQSTGDGTNPAQDSALGSATRLVTLGIGGNDIGFSSLLTRCVETGLVSYAIHLGVLTSGDAPCRDQNVVDGTDLVQQRIEQAGSRLRAALDEIERRAPEAEVYLVGYPAILPTTGTGCSRALGLAPGDVTYLHDKERQLNAMLQRQAKAAGVHYVDTYTPSVGFDACSTQDTRWIEPLVPRSPAAAVHPNARGERGMADAVIRALTG